MKTQSQRVFVALIVISILLLGVVVAPFAKAIFFAAVLAAALYPWHRKLSAKLIPKHPAVSAAVMCFFVLAAVVAPIGGIAGFAVKETVEGGRFVVQTVQKGGLHGLLDELPEPVRKLTDQALQRFPVDEQEINESLQEQARTQGGKAARAITDVLASSGEFVLQAGLLTIALFFMLIDGGHAVTWLEQVSPLDEGQTTELLIEFRRVTGSVLFSAITTAGVQAIGALIGYLIARVPHPLFFTAVTFFFAFIPAIGAGGVCLAAALVVFATGNTGWAIFMAVWGVVVVGIVDNLIKPILAKRGMHMHGGIVFFSLLGGLASMGFVGLLAGPLIVSFFLALVRIYQRDYGRHPEVVDATGRSAASAGTGAQGKLIV